MTLAHRTMPTSPGFAAIDFGLVGNSQEYRSPLVQSSQIAVLSGARWRAVYTVPVTTGADLRAWRSFLASLRGRAYAFRGHDPSFESYAGLANITVNPSATTFDSTAITWDSTLVTFDEWAGPLSVGAPYVRESGQTGEILKTAGWLPGLRLEAGEYASFDYVGPNGNALTALHMIRNSITVGDGGEVNLTLDPPVRVAPALNQALRTDRPSCSMRLVSDDGGRWSVDEHGHQRVTFEAEQVLLAEAA